MALHETMNPWIEKGNFPENPDTALQNIKGKSFDTIQQNTDIIGWKLPQIQAFCERWENGKHLQKALESPQCGFPNIFKKYNLIPQNEVWVS